MGPEPAPTACAIQFGIVVMNVLTTYVLYVAPLSSAATISARTL